MFRFCEFTEDEPYFDMFGGEVQSFYKDKNSVLFIFDDGKVQILSYINDEFGDIVIPFENHVEFFKKVGEHMKSIGVKV